MALDENNGGGEEDGRILSKRTQVVEDLNPQPLFSLFFFLRRRNTSTFSFSSSSTNQNRQEPGERHVPISK